jgi:hypothetical protein
MTPGGSSTVDIHTPTIHRTTQSTRTIHRTTQFTNQEDRALSLRDIPWHCLTTEEKARKNLSQGSRRMPTGKEYTEQSILVNKNNILVNNKLELQEINKR